MYDLHCHLLPGLDDGPKTIEEAMAMAQLAYEDGTRHLVCTPHVHHPLGFVSDEEAVEAAFRDMEARLKAAFPDLRIYKGAEIYLPGSNPAAIGEMALPGLHGTGYLLVEFDRNTSADAMENALHELQILGFRPIMAHVEEYKALREDLERLARWRREGILLQCNSGHLAGSKRHPAIRQAARKLVRSGLVDFVASDGHGPDRRKPLLAGAFRWTIRNAGAAEAERMFLENPRMLLQGGGIDRPARKSSIRRKGFKGWFTVAAILVLAGLLASCMSFLQTEEEPEAQTETMTETQTEAMAEGVEGEAEAPEAGQAPERDEAPAEEPLPPSEDAAAAAPEAEQEAEQEPVPSHSPMVQAYVDHLKGLEENYLEEVERLYQALAEAAGIEDPAARDERIGSLLDELGLLESQSDNKVYRALYDMQNDLEDLGEDTAIVGEIRTHYITEKERVAEDYRTRLETLYGN